jgi:hypothetical protein
MHDATVAMEDRHFYSHHGLDWEALHRALRVNLRAGEIRQGGSTITQQLAKNLFLTNERTFGRKIKEAALALEMERQLPKERILELYLNTIHYGMGQHGIKAAARHYFHKTPAELTLAESAVLVGLVPKPPQQELDLEELAQGRRTALARIALRWSNRYTQTDIEKAAQIPLDRLMYPFKNAWDRGATEHIPPVWQQVSFYAFVSEEIPASIPYVSSVLKWRLAQFLKEARRRHKVVGIDHLGVYADRPVRGSKAVLSAHAFGQAIDIAGFRFADGSHVRVKEHADPRVARRLAPLAALLRRHFDVVLDWQNEPKRHHDHYHAEVKGKRDVAAGAALPG